VLGGIESQPKRTADEWLVCVFILAMVIPFVVVLATSYSDIPVTYFSSFEFYVALALLVFNSLSLVAVFNQQRKSLYFLLTALALHTAASIHDLPHANANLSQIVIAVLGPLIYLYLSIYSYGKYWMISSSLTSSRGAVKSNAVLSTLKNFVVFTIGAIVTLFAMLHWHQEAMDRNLELFEIADESRLLRQYTDKLLEPDELHCSLSKRALEIYHFLQRVSSEKLEESHYDITPGISQLISIDRNLAIERFLDSGIEGIAESCNRKSD